MQEPSRPGLRPLGMLGGGQLGRMFVQAAHAQGREVHVFSPDADGPAAQAADAHTAAGYDDLDAVRRFAASVDGVSYEFENVPAATAAACAEAGPVRPGGNVLAVAQDRREEKAFLEGAGVPIAPWAAVGSEAELAAAGRRLGFPCVLKTARGGYDGKGQRVLHDAAEVPYAWADLQPGDGREVPCVLEARVDFQAEVSVIAARDAHGGTVTWGPIANSHRNHILDVSAVPAGLGDALEAEAVAVAEQVVAAFELVGVLCVECFVTRSDASGPRILVNEIAPRPHNSGHLTIEAYELSQFAAQALCLGGGRLPSSPGLRRPAAMANLLGDVWGKGGEPPRWDAIAGREGVTVHRYGKAVARPGRKMGHVTALAGTAHEAVRNAVEARAALRA
ncbi:5-(carboxyamino)imidazole ribonucleotide synthase [Phycisphaera mikurensis]|uniref:N5-carboxyaminoimidazole ribonucleotide synthase n=1 Tax=Phycisphaera mikurensis (strain NBRC 102666 / KCTC 22515 / FYK2301M01) TaxID=1142394 RepID=I0IDD4_PHYMF|nr:5-(carboxyamino)imidazole ribonucleotide synthase [Phycisphaera mikurensis]MBB6443341.1 5-(carboxyamino)imidazole ribonucleotide synthase [Phycisphaera mikurensis]BAM03272.1 N5-carboxyaminoimidazole ribonucleotide synthase [Phycisphaera mikurensis NBRC 102666]